jgi:hypothetical protein
MSPRSFLLAAAIVSASVSGNGVAAFTSSPSSSIITLSSSSYTTSLSMSSSRRNFLNNLAPTIAAGAIFIASSNNAANALDFDAFENGEIAADTKSCDPKKDPKCIPKLSEDEALCQYGGGGKARGEACRRVRDKGGKLPEVKKEKSLGGAYAM